MTLERATIEGNSPVFENPFVLLVITLEYHETKKILWEAGWTTQPRLNTTQSPIVNQYREGKVKSRGVTPVK